MQPTNTVRPNGDAVSEESAATGSVHRRPPASTVVGAGVASGKSGAPTNEIDPAVEAAMEKAMGRFVKRGPPSTPVRGPTSHSAQYPSRGTQIRDPAPGTPPGPAFYTAPPASTTGNGRKPAQTATGHTTSKQKS